MVTIEELQAEIATLLGSEKVHLIMGRVDDALRDRERISELTVEVDRRTRSS